MGKEQTHAQAEHHLFQDMEFLYIQTHLSEMSKIIEKIYDQHTTQTEKNVLHAQLLKHVTTLYVSELLHENAPHDPASNMIGLSHTQEQHYAVIHEMAKQLTQGNIKQALEIFHMPRRYMR